MKSKVTLILTVLLCQIINAQDWTAFVDDVYSYSSPKAVDLNNDNIKDIVLGAGIEDDESDYGVVAINGDDGSELWHSYSRNQLFSNPIFQDINGDNIPDVFIGGRAAEFRAINGANGDLIWEFFPEGDTVDPTTEGWFNFYSPQWVPDQDNDGLQDLLVANGGDYTAPNFPSEGTRPPGILMVLSSADGSILAQDTMPDGQETYMSPLVVDLYNNNHITSSENLYVIFGTGGENTFNFGHLYKAPLIDLMNNDLSNAIEIIASPEKGFIAPPSMVDINDDSVLDFIVNLYDGKIVAVDGFTNELIWEVEIEMGETNASPGIGHFTDDNVPDVFATYAIGLAPTFTDFRQIMIDGATGNILFDESIGFFQFNSPVVVDLDDDGFDEVILPTNNVNANQQFTNDIKLIDFNDATLSTLFGPNNGANVNSTPLLTNLDEGGLVDFIYLHSESQSFGGFENGLFLKKESLGQIADNNIAWGGYLGNNGDGIYQNPLADCVGFDAFFELSNITYPTCNNLGSVSIFPLNNFCGIIDCTYNWFDSSTSQTQTATDLTAGRHFIEISNGICSVILEVYMPLQTASFSIDINEGAICNYIENSNELQIEIINAASPFEVCFDGVCGGATTVPFYINNNVDCGMHTISVLDADNCYQEESFLIPCPITITANVTEPSQPDAMDAQVEIAVSGGSGNYTLLWDNEIINETTIENLGIGTYSLTVEDDNGCSENTSISVIYNSIVDINKMVIIYIENGFLNIVNEQVIDNWKLFNLNGQLVNEGKSIDNRQKIPFNKKASGLYLFTFEIAGTWHSKKVTAIR